MVTAMHNFNRVVHPTLDWKATARAAARLTCRSRHNTARTSNVSITTDFVPTGATASGPTDNRFQIESGPPNYVYQSRPWTATCVKKVKGPRR